MQAKIFKENIATKRILSVMDTTARRKQALTSTTFSSLFPCTSFEVDQPSWFRHSIQSLLSVSTIISNSCCSLCECAVSLSSFCLSLNSASCLSLSFFSRSFCSLSLCSASFSLISASCLSLSFLSRSFCSLSLCSTSACSFSLLSSSLFCLSLSSLSNRSFFLSLYCL